MRPTAHGNVRCEPIRQGEGDAPLFSVIVPTYQRPEFVARAVRSILHQTIESFECRQAAGQPRERHEHAIIRR